MTDPTPNRAWLIAAALCALMLSGCFHRWFRPEEESECGPGRPGEVQCAAYKILQCRPGQITVRETSLWRAIGCNKEALCDTVGGEWVCQLVQSPEERAANQIAVETGCDAKSIGVKATAPSPKGYPTLRMAACGVDWICDLDDHRAWCSRVTTPASL